MTARSPLAHLLPLLLPLLLAGCGDEAPAGFAGAPGAGPGLGPRIPVTASEVMEGTLDAAYAIELDDAALERLLATHRRVLAAGGDVSAGMAAAGGAAGYTQYARALIQWKAMTEAARKGAARAQRDLDALDEGIAQLAAQLPGAAGPERARIEQNHAQQVQLRAVFAKNVAQLERLATPEVRALVETWQPRFEAVEAEFDE